MISARGIGMPKSFGKLDLIYATRVEYFPEWKGYTSALELTEKEYWGMTSNVITQTGLYEDRSGRTVLVVGLYSASEGWEWVVQGSDGSNYWYTRLIEPADKTQEPADKTQESLP